MNKRSDIPTDQLIAEYQAGDSLTTIARRHDVTGPCVRYRLKQAGVVFRPTGNVRDRRLKTHCKYGHPLAGDNLYPRYGKSQPRCRECHKAAMLRRYYAKKQVQP